MAQLENEIRDSQLLAEHVSFLNNCFDTSFSLHSSLSVVKEYVAEEQIDFTNTKPNKYGLCDKNNTSLQNRTMLDTSHCSNIGTTKNSKIMSKKLQDWGLPPEITRKYEERGITEMFDWQVSCLSNSKVLLDGCNLVYSAPTSAGKTLVAEILTIKTILERRKKVIIILPFVSIVREKMFYLQDILSSCGIRVEGFMGSQAPPGGFQAVHLAICTIEKANSLINKLLDEGSISELGAVIVDELHLLGDSHRGYILELLLTKIKYISSKSEDVQTQIVGMSATLPNLEMLAQWLSAELFVTEFRPIPLDEYCLVGNKYYDKHRNSINFVNNFKNSCVDNDNVLNICLDTLKDGCSVLIFCMTKNRCEHLAQSISSSFNRLGCGGGELGSLLRKQLSVENITEVLEQLKNCPVGLDDFLKRTISFGVAYHHAGLTFDERDIIEGGFKSGAIRVLIATSTLSSGVNLPARKVIIRSPVFQRQPIDILSYKQMVGRAGRMGRDTKGESILICTEAEKQTGFDLMTGELEPVKSCIESEDKFMRAVLEMIASQVVCTKEDLDLYAKCTLLYNQKDVTPSQNFLLENTLEELKNFELVRIQDVEGVKHYVATPLGKACLSSSMAPNDGLSLFCELQKARQCLVLETDLHLIYLVTPYSVSSQWSNIDWLHLLTLWESLTKAMKRVGELVGVQESFIIRNVRGGSKIKSDQNKLNIHKRFYTALALQDLVNEVPLSEVAIKFQCARGFLQSLQQAAATFAGMVTAFCRQLAWRSMEMLVSQFQDRLHFGIHSELLELMGLPSLNGKRARTLFDAGYETISSIALADINVIENILLKAVPFESEKVKEAEDYNDMKKRNKIKNIWVTGYCGMTSKEAALNLIVEARKYLEKEIGVSDIKWNNEIQNCRGKPQNVKDANGFHEKKVNYSKVHIVNENCSVTQIKEAVGTENFVTHILEDKSSPEKINEININLKDQCSDAKVKNKNSLIVNKSLNITNGKSVLESINNEILEIKLSPVVQKVIICNSNSPSLELKDEIVWDSLNFTEAALENITKLRTSEKMFSPNISFGENDEKIEVIDTEVDNTNKITPSKSTSIKDVSLFSSDGDSSSIFNDSLPIDLIPSNLLNNKTNILIKQDTVSDLEVINSESILNAFKSTLVSVDDDQDIKLVYEEDDENKEIITCLNVSDNIEEIETQQVNETVRENNFKSPFKRPPQNGRQTSQPVSKKKKIDSLQSENLQTNYSLHNIVAKCNKSKKYTIRINNYNLNCFLLKDNDIYDNIHVIENLQTISMYLNIKNTVLPFNEIIGSSILNVKSPAKEDNPCAIQGIAFYFEPMTCMYFDLRGIVGNMSMIKKRLCSWFRKFITLKVLSLKTLNFHIKRWLGVDVHASCVDVSLAEWLIDSDDKIPNIAYLMKKYCKIDLSAISVKIDNQLRKIRNLDISEDMCIKAWAVGMIAEQQEQYLRKHLQSTIDIEIQVSKILANCEHYGITVDKDLASRLLIDVRNSQEVLQKKAFKLCGYHFNFNSSKDVAKVLGINNGVRKVSTKKSVLTSHHSPMASIVIYWRKLNSILTKTLYPLTEKACIYTEGDRINPSYTTHTCTGRISMHEPNLQNVPRTFSIPLHYLSVNQPTSEDLMEFNCRNIFKAAPGHVMVSADYCQLELRVLTHFSEDPVLTKIMKSDVDVFKSIASSWSNLPEDEVDDDLRQKAKQLCYGILYGMGNKTLAQYLDVSEMEAAAFMDSFYKTYPAVRKFTQSVIDDCRNKGYVETLTKRRRYLPHINSNVSYKKGAAERQAVNTTIQGSAADIAKAAMCAIDTKTDRCDPKPRLILQMHDELIYEVREPNKHFFIAVLKQVMEETVKLKVPLPVKVKSGNTWGSLEEVRIK